MKYSNISAITRIFLEELDSKVTRSSASGSVTYQTIGKLNGKEIAFEFRAKPSMSGPLLTWLSYSINGREMVCEGVGLGTSYNFQKPMIELYELCEVAWSFDSSIAETLEQDCD